MPVPVAAAVSVASRTAIGSAAKGAAAKTVISGGSKVPGVAKAATGTAGKVAGKASGAAKNAASTATRSGTKAAQSLAPSQKGAAALDSALQKSPSAGRVDLKQNPWKGDVPKAGLGVDAAPAATNAEKAPSRFAQQNRNRGPASGNTPQGNSKDGLRNNAQFSGLTPGEKPSSLGPKGTLDPSGKPQNLSDKNGSPKNGDKKKGLLQTAAGQADQDKTFGERARQRIKDSLIAPDKAVAGLIGDGVYYGKNIIKGSAAVAAGLILFFGFTVGGGAVVTSAAGGAAAGITTKSDCNTSSNVLPGGDSESESGVTIDTLNESQKRNAQSVINEAAKRSLPSKAAVIALATAMQESTLLNYANSSVPESMSIPHEAVGSDHDSVGIFQQRPGWGTVEDRMNPTKSAGFFFDRLVRVPNWDTLPVTVAAQKVQVSAYPDAYAKWETLANTIVSTMPAQGGGSFSNDVSDSACGGQVSPTGGEYGFPTANTAYIVGRWQCYLATYGGGKYTCESGRHDGIDITGPGANSHSDPVFAMTDGTVTIARPQGSCYNWVSVRGLDQNTLTYLHMSSYRVKVGDIVKKGQQIGNIGGAPATDCTSGNHLHLMVQDSAGTRIDSLPFIEARGVKYNKIEDLQ